MGKVAVHTGGGGGGELPYVVGTYRGSGSTAGTHIQLGFMPTAVLIENERGLRGWADRPSENVGGLLLRDRIIGDAGNAAARVTETGFFVITSLDRIDRYCYIAFR